MTDSFEKFIEGTDLALNAEQRKSYLNEIVQKSTDENSLLENYCNVMKEKTSSYCSADCIKDVFSWGLAYKLKNSPPEKVKEIAKSNFLLYKAVSYRIEEIRKNEDTEKMAQKIYSFLEPNFGTYKCNFDLTERPELLEKSIYDGASPSFLGLLEEDRMYREKYERNV